MNGNLVKMDMNQAKEYQSYRYERERKQSNALLLVGCMALFSLGVLGLFGREWLELKVIGLIVIAQVIIMSIYFLSVQLELKKLKATIEMPYEYAVQNVILNKECELLRENGEKVTYKVQNDKRNIFRENEEIVVVYIPQCKKIYVEKKASWEMIVKDRM